MRPPQFVERQRERQFAGVPDLQPVGEQHHLHAGIARVVAVNHGIDDGLSNNLARQLVINRRLWPLGAGAHTAGDFRHHEVNRLIHQLEHCALVDLIRGDRLAQFGAVKMHALDFGTEQKPLRLRAK